MKMKRITNFCLIMLLAVFAIFTFANPITASVFAMPNYGKIIINGNISSSTYIMDFPNANENSRRTFTITGFDFAIDDTITYYYINNDEDIKYKTIRASNAATITVDEDNISLCSELSIDPYTQLGGAGTYTIMAKIWDDSLNAFVLPEKFTLILKEYSQPANLSLTIKIVEEKNTQGTVVAYLLKSNIYVGNTLLDTKRYIVRWFINDLSTPVSLQRNFEYVPENYGTFSVYAVVYDTASSIQPENPASASDEIVFSKDMTLTILLYIGIGVVVVGIITALSIVVNIKKERVW